MIKKIIVFVFISLTLLNADACGGCGGCDFFWENLESVAENIDSKHEELEEELNDYFTENIIPLLEDIDLLQIEMTKLVAHIEIMEVQAVIDTKEIGILLDNSMKINVTKQGHQ